MPYYKIEIYTGTLASPTLIHSITDELVPPLRFKSCFGIPGNFSFGLPMKMGSTITYADIQPFNIVKLYAGLTSLPSSPNFVGRIENISNQNSIQGAFRIFSGRDLAEVTTRLIRHQYNTGGGTAHTFADKIASDCGLTADTTADATAVEILSYESKYDELLKALSDYGASINKDWYVDTSNALVWKVRPIRSMGVSVLTEGDNIKSYILTKGLQNEVFNTFYVFGASEEAAVGTSVCSGLSKCSSYNLATTDIPTDHDSWTESADDPPTNWTADSGSDAHVLVHDQARKHVGSNEVECAIPLIGGGIVDDWIWIKYPVGTTTPIKVKDRAMLHYTVQHKSSGTLNSYKIRLFAPDDSNYFEYSFSSGNFPAQDTTTHTDVELGANVEATSGDDKWIRTGDPSWFNIQYFRLYMQWNYANTGGLFRIDLDGLWFGDLRWSATDSDTTSHDTYGHRDMVVVDDTIHSNTAATSYAAYLKARYKDVPMQLDITLPLDTNILLGDRIPITLANETQLDGSALSNVDFDVIRVEQTITNEGGLTNATLVSLPRMRDPVKTTDNPTVLREMKQHSLDIAKGIVTVR